MNPFQIGPAADGAADLDPRRSRRRIHLLVELKTRLRQTLPMGSTNPIAAARLLALLQTEALRTMGEDNVWICPEAIESLT